MYTFRSSLVYVGRPVAVAITFLEPRSHCFPSEESIVVRFGEGVEKYITKKKTEADKGERAGEGGRSAR